MSRRFALGAVLLVALPFAVWLAIWGRDRLTLHRLAQLDPPVAVLAEATEDTARPPGAWLLLAIRDRELFDGGAAFCRQYAELPLPNCANLLIADRLVALLPAEAFRPGAADAR